jgi:hypothetical protein
MILAKNLKRLVSGCFAFMHEGIDALSPCCHSDLDWHAVRSRFVGGRYRPRLSNLPQRHAGIHHCGRHRPSSYQQYRSRRHILPGNTANPTVLVDAATYAASLPLRPPQPQPHPPLSRAAQTHEPPRIRDVDFGVRAAHIPDRVRRLAQRPMQLPLAD